MSLTIRDDMAGGVAVRPERKVAPVTWLRSSDGSASVLDVAGWSGAATDLEHRLLAELDGPVLDIGCGPGRLVVCLGERGVPALGVDASPVAIGHAVRRQAPALVRSVFGPIPATGRWRSALLFDANIGIGGNPALLLQRVAELLAPSGRLLVELGPPGLEPSCFAARVERGDDHSHWFPWARLGMDDIAETAVGSGLRLTGATVDEDRWFAYLEKRL